MQFESDDGITVGVLARRFDYGEGTLPFDNLLTVQASYSTYGRKDAFIDFERTNIGIYDLRWGIGAAVESHNGEPYYGVGDDLTLDYERLTNGYYLYSHDTVSVGSSLRKRLYDNWDLSTGLGLELNYQRSNQNDSQFFQDFGGGLVKLYNGTVGVGLVHDKRNLEFIPDRGHYFGTGFTLSPGFMNNIETWYRVGADFRYYIPLIDDRWLWLATQVRYGHSSDNAPITDKVRMGSAGTLRGLRYGRYLTNHSASVRAELRSIVIRLRVFDMPFKGGAGIFVDTGKAGSTLGRLFGNPIQHSVGFSLIGSYFTDDFIGHADVGFTKEGYSLYVGLGHVF